MTLSFSISSLIILSWFSNWEIILTSPWSFFASLSNFFFLLVLINKWSPLLCLKWWLTICLLNGWLELLIRFAKSGRILSSVFLFSAFSFSWPSIFCSTYSLNSFSLNFATKPCLNSKFSLVGRQNQWVRYSQSGVCGTQSNYSNSEINWILYAKPKSQFSIGILILIWKSSFQ